MTIHYKILLLLLIIPFNLVGQINGREVYKLKGRLFYESGHPFQTQQEIDLAIGEKWINSVATDSAGFFEFGGLSEGTYRLIAKQWSIDTIVVLPRKQPELIWFFLPGVCEVNQQVAKTDIERNQIRLLLVGSIAPAVYSNQHIFEKKFNVIYYDFGCTPPDTQCIIEYNKTIFDFLDRKYGKKWRKSVRPDVIGYNKAIKK